MLVEVPDVAGRKNGHVLLKEVSVFEGPTLNGVEDHRLDDHRQKSLFLAGRKSLFPFWAHCLLRKGRPLERKLTLTEVPLELVPDHPALAHERCPTMKEGIRRC